MNKMDLLLYVGLLEATQLMLRMRQVSPLVRAGKLRYTHRAPAYGVPAAELAGVKHFIISLSHLDDSMPVLAFNSNPIMCG